VAATELQELLLTLEEDPTQREEALAAWEEKVGILEKALTKVSADLDPSGPRLRLLSKSTTTRWRLIPLAPSTPSTSIRCWGRRRSSSMGESMT
jgi:hypothetical protein